MWTRLLQGPKLASQSQPACNPSWQQPQQQQVWAHGNPQPPVQPKEFRVAPWHAVSLQPAAVQICQCVCMPPMGTCSLLADHSNTIALPPAAAPLYHSDAHAQMVAAGGRHKQYCSGNLARIAKLRGEQEEAERAQQELEAAMRPPTGSTLTRREWCCCGAVRRLRLGLGCGCPPVQPPPCTLWTQVARMGCCETSALPSLHPSHCLCCTAAPSLLQRRRALWAAAWTTLVQGTKHAWQPQAAACNWSWRQPQQQEVRIS
jgi:hypothetical protein